MNEKIDIEEVAPWLAIAIAFVGGWLRVFMLGTRGLWLDETISIWLASHPVAEMIQWITRIDQHPPLYYLLLHYWLAFTNDTPYYVRLLSALFGAATIPVIYLIGKRISGAVMGLAAAAFLALSLFNIYFAQETRMYTLLGLNVALAMYALVRLLTDPRSVRPLGSQFVDYVRAWRTSGPVEPSAQGEFSYRDDSRNQTGWRGWIYRHRWLPIQAVETDLAWLAFMVFSAAALLTHNTAVLFLLAANLFVFGMLLFRKIKPGTSEGVFQPPSFWNWVKAQVGIVLLWSPWLAVFIKQAASVDREYWIPMPSWDSVTHTLRTLLNPSAETQASLVMTWILCGLLCFGLLHYRKRLSVFFFLAVMFFTPILAELLISLRRPIYLDRTLIWITIPLFLLLAAGTAQLKYPIFIILAIGTLSANFLFSAGDYYRFSQKEDWNGPAGYVANYVENGDLILFNSAMVQIPFDYYFRPYENKYLFQTEKRGVPDMFERRIPEPRMTENDLPALVSLLNGRKRVWLVYSHDSYTDPKGLIPKTLAEHMQLTRSREYFGALVQLYEAP